MSDNPQGILLTKGLEWYRLLACAASVLPLSYNNRTTTNLHNPLYVQVVLMHTPQPLS